MAAKHKIKAYLYDNALTKDDLNDYSARVASERSLNVRSICESATARGGADVSAAAMEHAVNLFHKEMSYLLCDGFSVNTGWYHASPRIKGVFNSPTETFNREKHSIDIKFNQGALLREEVDTVEVDVHGMAETGCFIAQVVDIKTGSVNDIVTPNRNVRITGHKLKIAGDDTRIGVYFVEQANDGQSIKVPDVDIVNNNPAELLIVAPQEMNPGTAYKLEVVTQFTGSGGKMLKEPRTATFDRTLTAWG